MSNTTTTIPTFPADLVRIVREAYGETQREFAVRLGIKQPTLARWELADDKNFPQGPAAILLRQLAKRKKISVPKS